MRVRVCVSAFGDAGCLRALVTLLTSMQRFSAVFEQLEGALIPLFTTFLNVEKMGLRPLHICETEPRRALGHMDKE